MTKIKYLLLLLILTISTIRIYAQGAEVLKAPKFPGDIYVKENTRTRKSISYTSLREADVMWSKRVWRQIDLKEKMNLPLYYPVTPKEGRKSLFDVIKEAAIQTGDITCFDDGPDIMFINEMTKTEVEGKVSAWDSTHTVDDINNPGATIVAPIKKDLTSDMITKYQLKEDWFFDRQRSVLDVRIIGMLILQAKTDEKSGDVIGEKAVFSIFFPQARPVFANNEVYMRHNDTERRTFDDIFWKRMFSSYVVKETNVYDRVISEYTSGLSALLESDRIKNDIFTFEHDMWHF